MWYSTGLILHNLDLTKTMQTFTMNPRNWGVGTKITVFTFGLIAVILAMLLSLINMSTSAMLTERAKANVANTLDGINNTVEVFNTAMTNEATSFARLFAAGFGDGKFTLDTAAIVDIGGKATPSLKHDGKTLNLDLASPTSSPPTPAWSPPSL